ncbi:hypothetical protein ACX3YC_22110 [Pseudomonas mohnii]
MPMTKSAQAVHETCGRWLVGSPHRSDGASKANINVELEATFPGKSRAYKKRSEGNADQVNEREAGV